MRNWLLLETELCDIIRRTLPFGPHLDELPSGDKAVGYYVRDGFYEQLNVTLLAKELDARGIHCAAQALRVSVSGDANLGGGR